jgi:hypothetical protein
MALAFRADHPRALAMYCSDGRFARAVRRQVADLARASTALHLEHLTVDARGVYARVAARSRART